MKLIELKCKNCGSKLKVAEDFTDIICQFCGANFKIDDEVVHHKIDDAEKTGYEMEKGRLRAQKEYEEEEQERRQAEYYTKKRRLEEEKRKKDNLKWWIIGWIFCFPIPLTILIWRSKWEQKKKIIATVALWGFILIFGLLNDSTQNTEQTSNTTTSSNESETAVDNNVELFGDSKAYLDNEKNIRLFVIGYNSNSSNKIVKVEWMNNHTIAYLNFNDERCEINDHKEKGFIITCNFANGKEKLSSYESILLDMLKYKDNGFDLETAKSKLLEAKNNNMKIINITNNITIQYNYLKEAVGIRAADSYIIEMIIGK